MQKNFISKTWCSTPTGIKASNKKIKEYTLEVDNLLESNETKTVDVSKLIKEQENVTGAGKKLKKLKTLKGKLSNKVTTITKEHKFFSDNTVCPTCTQSINEEFRIDRIRCSI